MSLKGLGLLAHIMSHGPGWDFSLDRVAKETATGISSVRSAIAELEDLGYVERHRMRDRESGLLARMDYTLKNPPHLENPTVDTPL